MAVVDAFISCSRVLPQSRITGNYIAHNDNFVESLRLIQGGNGLVTGVLSSIRSENAKLETSELQVSGNFDNGQITLILHTGLGGIGDTTLSGSVKADCIVLQGLGKNAEILNYEYCRAAPTDFNRYADLVRARTKGKATDKTLEETANAAQKTIKDLQSWVSNVRVHEQRIDSVKDKYRAIENKMLELLSRQKAESNPDMRAQIISAIYELNSTGLGLDSEANSVWMPIVQDGETLSQNFAKLTPNCTTLEATVVGLGASETSMSSWRVACRKAMSIKEYFGVAFQTTSKNWVELQAFISDSRRRRQSIMDECAKTS